MRYSK